MQYIILVMIIIIAMILCLILKGYLYYKEAIKIETLEQKIYKIREQENYVPLSAISTSLLVTIIVLEDSEFFCHKGFQIKRILEAMYVNITSHSKKMGGSSISQQLAKNMFFSFKKTYRRKIAELFVVRQLEKKYSKQEILEIYLNIIYYGNNQYGINDASQFYFSKNPNDLTFFESITIGALLPAPSVYNPVNVNGYFQQARRNALNKLFEYCLIRQEDLNSINKLAYSDQWNPILDYNFREFYNIVFYKMTRGLVYKTDLLTQSVGEFILGKIHTNTDFINDLIYKSNQDSQYAFGGIMQQITPKFIEVKAKQYPEFYSEDKKKELLNSKNAYGCDCSGLIKSYLFGYNLERYIEYLDFNSFMMLSVAHTKGEIATLPEIQGVCLYMKGHVGIYLGNQQVLECTSSKHFGDGVVITNLTDRLWENWYYCPFICYKENINVS